MRPGMRKISIGVAVAAVLAAGCTRAGPAAPMPSWPGASPTQSPAQSPAGPSAAAPLPSAIAYAVHQRQQFGLRADVAWVEQVAADPTARVMLLDIPLTPAEEQWFEARQASFGQVESAIQAEAASAPDEFGGLYLDQATGHVVGLFTANPDRHRQAILGRLGETAPLIVKQVTYAESTLRALQDRISSDVQWLRGIQAAAVGIGVDTIHNRTSLELSSANPEAPALALAHYSVPANELAVTEDGTGAALLPRGTIDVSVTAATGVPTPAGGWELDFAGDGPGECGGEVGHAVAPGRVAEIPCQVGGWTVTLLDDNRSPVASGHVTVVAGKHAQVTIAVP